MAKKKGGTTSHKSASKKKARSKSPQKAAKRASAKSTSKQHPKTVFHCTTGCTEPDQDQTVWRYMDLAKYIDLLTRKKLFFSRVGLMEDKFEGTYTHRILPSDDEIARMIEHARTHQADLVAGYDDDKLRAIIKASREASVETVGRIRDYAYITCWHENEFESAGMWKLYLKSGEGVAVRTSYSRLKESLTPTVPKSVLLAGQIEYLDYDASAIPHMDFFMPFMRKRRSFEHEREVRLACIDMDAIEKASSRNKSELRPGVDFDANLDKLIERVHVAPSTPSWFHNVVKSVTRKFGLKKEVVKSDLDNDPIK